MLTSYTYVWTHVMLIDSWYDHKLVNSLHRLLNCEIGGLDYRVITTEYRTRVHCIHMYHLFCNVLVYVIYSVVSGQYSYTIQACYIVILFINTCKFDAHWTM